MSERPPGEMQFRTATVIKERWPERIIEMIVMPYEDPTLVAHEGDMVWEVISRGAFDGIQRRANRIKLNRDHDEQRSCGKALSLHPGRPEGLVAEVYISRSPLGEETLTLAEEGILDVSAGFLPMPGGARWEERGRRRIDKAWLGHIAMVPEPAYEGARPLSFREADDPPRSSTPNLDQVRAWRLDDVVASDPALQDRSPTSPL